MPGSADVGARFIAPFDMGAQASRLQTLEKCGLEARVPGKAGVLQFPHVSYFHYSLRTSYLHYALHIPHPMKYAVNSNCFSLFVHMVKL